MAHPNTMETSKLLSDKRVIEEIHRHLWIESEKSGFDIGFEKATEDWLDRFSKAWMRYHLPSEALSPQKPVEKVHAAKTTAKRRRAKSYLH